MSWKPHEIAVSIAPSGCAEFMAVEIYPSVVFVGDSAQAEYGVRRHI